MAKVDILAGIAEDLDLPPNFSPYLEEIASNLAEDLGETVAFQLKQIFSGGRAAITCEIEVTGMETPFSLVVKLVEKKGDATPARFDIALQNETAVLEEIAQSDSETRQFFPEVILSGETAEYTYLVIPKYDGEDWKTMLEEEIPLTVRAKVLARQIELLQENMLDNGLVPLDPNPGNFIAVPPEEVTAQPRNDTEWGRLLTRSSIFCIDHGSTFKEGFQDPKIYNEVAYYMQDYLREYDLDRIQALMIYRAAMGVQILKQLFDITIDLESQNLLLSFAFTCMYYDDEFSVDMHRDTLLASIKDKIDSSEFKLDPNEVIQFFLPPTDANASQDLLEFLNKYILKS